MASQEPDHLAAVAAISPLAVPGVAQAPVALT
jgi:hypothetical protein